MAPAPHEILLPRLARVSLCFGSSHVIGSLAKRIQRSYTRQCVVLVAGQGDAQCDSNQESRPCQRDLPLSLYRVYRVSPLLLSFLPRSIFSLFFFLFSSVPPFFVSFSHSEPMKHAAQWDRPRRVGQRRIRTILLSFCDFAAGASDFTSLCRDKRLPEKYFEMREPRYGGTRETREDSERPKQSSCDWNKKQHPLRFCSRRDRGETQHRVKVDDGFNENKSHSRWGVDENTRRNGLGTERTFYATVVTGDVFARPDGWMDGCFAYAGNDALGKQRLGFLFGHVLLLDFLHPTRGRSCIRLVEERVSSAVSRTDPISGEKKWNRRATLFFLLPRSPFFPLKIVSFSS